jgi:microsomal dipeptidase-like Zn-dependent dipeptidase
LLSVQNGQLFILLHMRDMRPVSSLSDVFTSHAEGVRAAGQ